MTKAQIIEYLYENNVRGDLSIEQMADDLSEAERKRGEWIDFKNGWKCSACGKWNNETTNFCPNCGADMRGEE